MSKSENMLGNAIIGAAGLWIVLAISSVPAWLTHVIHCINNEEWFFLIAGAIAAPIGVIHGFGIWFGVW